MPILEVTPENNRQLQNIANTLAAAKKVVVFTGAGISTNCGIPDFRSEEGLYSLIQAKRDAIPLAVKSNNAKRKRPSSSSFSPNAKPHSVLIPNNVKGKDLFDSQLWKDPISTSVFYTFIASLRENIHDEVKKATSTHRFIKTLRDTRKLVRCYTQNIDGLEAREGLNTDMTQGKGSRARFTKKSREGQRLPARTQPGADLDGGCEVVQLHGDLEVLRCTLCQQTCKWEDRANTRLLAGKAPTCQLCATANQDRQDRGKRGTKVGTLRPNVVLYGEEHPSADVVGQITASDLTMNPDVLLILGTSLHVHGLKTMVREFAKAVHAKAGGKGKVVFVNLTKPSESVWKDVLDYWVSMDCDAWVDSMRRHRPDMFQTQAALKMQVKKATDKQVLKGVADGIAAAKPSHDKENMFNASVSSLQKYRQPRILLTPKKKRALQNKAAPAGKPSRLVLPSSPQKKRHLPDRSSWLLDQLEGAASGTSLATQEGRAVDPSQLPTPPSTGHRGAKRSLAQTYQELCDTPSKKRQKMGMDIWQD
ncbi:MAG: hypothetical protein ASARMPRED_007602 [Alectoria sarmentosa]|nr:MAG: hypothetical protein ASARMPRED_007602 [Alectoria sarmentosa]